MLDVAPLVLTAFLERRTDATILYLNSPHFSAPTLQWILTLPPPLLIVSQSETLSPASPTFSNPTPPDLVDTHSLPGSPWKLSNDRVSLLYTTSLKVP